MGAGSSARSSKTVLSAASLPHQLFVEGGGSVRSNGKFVLRTDKSGFPPKVVAADMCNKSAWFAKEDGEGCWVGFLDSNSDSNERRWMIFTATEILYIAPTTDGEISSPREGRWELGEKGAAPPPTVNQQPLPTSFRFSGWKGPHDFLNGEYMPLDDGAKLNNRPIFKHAPVLDGWKRQDKYRMHWSHGAWRIGEKEYLQPDTVQCMALTESEATHPTEIPEAVWKAMTSGLDCDGDEKDFEVAEGVSVETGTRVQININTSDGDDVTSLAVRPWFDGVKDLKAQVFFATDIPPQRQQLSFRGNQLHTDGRVLAQHGVIVECIIDLVTLEKKALLDAVFNESGTVEAMEVVGGLSPGSAMSTFDGGFYNPADGRIYLAPMNGTTAATFDPVTKTWETFGDTFPETAILSSDKWAGSPAVSSIDNCWYLFPCTMKVIHRMLKIDPINRTAQEIGEDMRAIIRTNVTFAIWATVAGADGCIYAIPCQINCVLRFDPRTKKITKFGKIDDMALQKNYPPGLLPDSSGRELKYSGGVLDATGRYIYCPPTMASRVLCIDTQELTVERIGGDFGICEGNNWVDHCKYMASDLGGDNCIYAIPWSSQITRVMRIDPTTKTASFFGPPLQTRRHMGMWYGACAGLDGCVYGTPHAATHILRLDPFAGTVSTVGEALPPDLNAKLGNCVVDRDGAIWHLPVHCPARMVRLATRRPQTPFLTSLVQPQHHAVLCEGLRDLRCYGPALTVALWREAVRVGGDSALVSGLLEAAATALPGVIMTSIKVNNGTTASRLLQTILAVLPPQKKDYYFNPTHNTWAWHEAEAHKRGMHLASVASKEEHALLHRITDGVETWLGGCRKSTSRQTPNDRSATEFKGAVDWEWSDGTPFSFTIWHRLEPNNGSNNSSGGEDRVRMVKNSWGDQFSGKMIAGIYRKPRWSPPLEAIRAIVTNRHVLSHCFAYSDELRGALVRVIYRIMALKDRKHAAKTPMNKSANASVNSRALVIKASTVDKTNSGPNSRAPAVITTIAGHLKTEWPDLSAVLLAVRRAPTSLSANDRHRFAFLSDFVNASAILQAPAPNTWQPLPASPDDWCWPPAPLVPLRSAAKIAQKLGSDVVRALWPVLAGAISAVLVRLVDAVKTDLINATGLLSTIFDRERKSSLGTYQKQLRRARRDPTFPEFSTTVANLMKQLKKFNRKVLRIQTTSSFYELYTVAEVMHKRYDEFLTALAHKCATSTALFAPLKGMARALEKLVLAPGVAAQFKLVGLEAIDGTHLTDVLRGSLKCPDFTEIVFILDLLEMLDVDMGNPKKAKAQGWDLEKYQIRLVHIKDRFNTPTSGGWADAMVNFCFVHGDDTHHVMELQLQHTQMLVVRKEGKAHQQYNSFRSAFELMEAVGHEPRDCFEETNEDLPPLEKVQRQMQQMQHQINELKSEVSAMKVENEVLRSTVKKLSNV